MGKFPLKKYPIPTTCRYCGHVVILTSNSKVYGKEVGGGKCYLCTHCNAYVGVYDGTNTPLGLLANEELRNLRKRVYELLNGFIKDTDYKKYECYSQLAKKLHHPQNQCDIGWFDSFTLKRAISILENGLFE